MREALERFVAAFKQSARRNSDGVLTAVIWEDNYTAAIAALSTKQEGEETCMVFGDLFHGCSEDWVRESYRWRGVPLMGEHAHWCPDWDDLPIDESSLEWPCPCSEGDAARALKHPADVAGEDSSGAGAPPLPSTAEKALREALEPFAALGGPNDGVMPAYHDIYDDVVVYANSGRGITAGDVRRARAALGILHAPRNPGLPPVLPPEPVTTDDRSSAAFAALERARTVLGNMAKEAPATIASGFKRRWLIHHEPLRADARNLLPVIDAALAEEENK